MTIHTLPTPALLLELSVFQANRAAMTAILKDTALALRPHYKSHKCAAIAHMQIADGAVGMTCAKLDEALDLADAGIEDILIANQIVDPAKIRRGASLAKRRMQMSVLYQIVVTAQKTTDSKSSDKLASECNRCQFCFVPDSPFEECQYAV